jgi:ubiquinone/menaquinone biosynthesis C-methylase UbiE
LNIEEKQKRAVSYYDKFSSVYDLLSPKSYYHKARETAVKELHLKENKVILNVPIGTGQNLEYFQKYLKNTGLIIGVDLSEGMLSKAQKKIEKNNWSNIKLLNKNAVTINKSLIEPILKQHNKVGVDAILVDLGLSGFPDWEKCIDSYLSLLTSKGKIVIMDWYIEKRTLRGILIKWIGKGEVNRPIYQYLESKVDNFKVNTSFNFGGVFVASGSKK